MFYEGQKVMTKVGPGRIIEVVTRGKTTKYRVDVVGRGNSFVFFKHEMESA